MGVHVDLEARSVSASVRDLCIARRDRGRAAGLLNRLRARLGQQVHAEHQRMRADEHDGFRAEVRVELTRRVDDFTAHVAGRIDGVIAGADGALLVEEVKSLVFTEDELAELTAPELGEFCRQARLYALCLSEAEPGVAVSARLVLVSVVDDSRRIVDVPFRADDARAELDELVRGAIAAARGERVRAEGRARSAAALSFPYEDPRPHQLELIDFIAAGLGEGRPVLAMAPTGIGKTVSALLPALRYALANNARLFYTTAKNTQQELVARTFLDLVAAAGPDARPLSAITLRAKERMCPPGDLQCHPELCPYLRDYAGRAAVSGAVDGLASEAAHVDPDTVYARGEALQLCPFELSLEVAQEADLVIGDYNYVYDAPLEAEAPRPTVVVADEVHNLFDRARGYYSPFLSRGALLRVQPPGAEPLFCELREVLGRAVDLIDAAAAAREGQGVDDCCPIEPDAEAWDAVAEDAARLTVRYVLHNRRQRILRPRDPLVDALRDVVRVRDAFASGEAELIPYAAGSAAPHGRGVGVACVNPARRLQRYHERALGTVGISATLTPLGYYEDVLGLAELGARTTCAPSPFPAEHRRVMIVPTVSTSFRERAEHYGAIARIIDDVTAARPGRYVAFFPSFAFLTAVLERLAIPRRRLLVQLPNMGEAARRRVLHELRGGPAPRLLLAVAGGVFAEGVDLPGDALIGAIVVGPALPGIGFERELMRRYYDEQRDGAGFAYSMLFPGMLRVVQSAGRVIRSMDDRGVIALVGRRFATAPYDECLPPDWYRVDPRELVTEAPGAAAAEFWVDQGPPESRPHVTVGSPVQRRASPAAVASTAGRGDSLGDEPELDVEVGGGAGAPKLTAGLADEHDFERAVEQRRHIRRFDA